MRWISLFPCLLLLSPPALATTWNIFADGSGDRPTIQAGIDAAAHYDTVLVHPGTYAEHISFEGKKIVVGSLFLLDGDPAWIEQTIIDPGLTYGSVVVFADDEEPLSVLCGLTITNGQGSAHGYVFGGGIFILEASPTLRHLIIRENGSHSSDLIGGGIAVLRGSPYMEHLLIEGNEAGYYGGGFACGGSDCRPVMRNSVFTGNWSQSSVAIDVDYGAHATFENVLIHGNSGSYAHESILCLSSRVDLINVTLADNPGLRLTLSGGTVVLVNSVLWNNDLHEVHFSTYGPGPTLVVSHTDLAGGEEGIETNGHGTIEWLDGNLDLDPMFLHPAGDDYTLRPGSPCIDAGAAYFLWDGQVLVDLDPADYCGDAPDMGAREFCPDPAVAREPPVGGGLRLSVRPNPALAGAAVSFTLSEAQPVTVTVFDLGGRLVSHLPATSRGPGAQMIRWDGRDLEGRPLPTGSYIVRLWTPEGESSANLLLLR